MVEDAKRSAWTIFQAKGYTNYTVSLAVELIVRSIIEDLRYTLPVSVLIDGYCDVRVTAEQKALLEKAASIQGVSLSAYTLLYLLPQAQKDVEAQERLVLTDRDRDLFLSAIANPPKLQGKLKTAIAQYRNKYDK